LRDALIADFETRYGSRPLLAFAPGRVNLIGDHIDYCGGSVLPMPIEQGTLDSAP
jgi:galactokinase